MASHADRPRLYHIAPRLAQARARYEVSELEWDREHRRLIAMRSEQEWSVGHRELQLVRSGCRRAAASDTKYMAKRATKLQLSSERLGQTRRDLAALERIPPGTFDIRRWRTRFAAGGAYPHELVA